ncbi:acetylornithine transaminase [Paenibacillus hamazuiensis]|uniref:acetylornithine transaminase n=1 Tax=Paenibacillus hamazuiensis TaxID=2936508 RepID=UPI00200D6DE6|nr:acetylornithine transaminase [Paenibacillus hamazuiensis]
MASAIYQLGEQVLISAFNRSPIVLSHGLGVRVWDTDGKPYLDFLGGFAVNTLGHCHPRVVKAVAEQADKLIHSSNLFYNEPSVRLAQLLTEHGAGDRIFFCPSGAEAVEAALKLARKYAYRQGERQKTRFVTALRSYHGRTFGALAASGKPEMQEGFGPLPEGFRYIPYNDLDALERAMDSSVCAVILEPVQGEAGAHVGSREFLRGARELCDRHGALLIFDEIQTGMGRTGAFFAYEHVGVKPDILTLAKGLSGGMPNAALAATDRVASAFRPGDHGATFGANPVVCAAGIATVETIVENDLLRHVREVGDYLIDRLRYLQTVRPNIADVRGRGLLIAVELSTDNKPVARLAAERGLLVAAGVGNTLRLLPPFIITKQDVDEALSILDSALRDALVTA